MKHLKLFENFTLTDLEKGYQDAKGLVELGLMDQSDLKYFEDQLRIQRYIADGSNGDLDLRRTPIQSLVGLTEVGGTLDLRYSSIQDLGELRKVDGNLDLDGTPIKSLGELRKVDGYLWLKDSQIQDLGELREVGYLLNLTGTPIAKTHTEQEIREQVQVEGTVLL